MQLSGRGPVSPLADQMFCAEEPTQHNVSNILAFFFVLSDFVAGAASSCLLHCNYLSVNVLFF